MILRRSFIETPPQQRGRRDAVKRGGGVRSSAPRAPPPDGDRSDLTPPVVPFRGGACHCSGCHTLAQATPTHSGQVWGPSTGLCHNLSYVHCVCVTAFHGNLDAPSAGVRANCGRDIADPPSHTLCVLHPAVLPTTSSSVTSTAPPAAPPSPHGRSGSRSLPSRG